MSKFPFFKLGSGLIVGLSVGAIVLAFNNPVGNPTTGGSIIGVGSGAPASSLYVDSAGKVGIGTTNPQNKLEVKDGNVAITNAGWGAWVLKQENISSYGLQSGSFVIVPTEGNHDFGIGAQVVPMAFVVKNSGNVGIGTTTPAYKLDIQGGQINTSGGLCIAGDCKTAWSQVGGGGANYWTLSGSSLYASSTGYNVGVGTASLDANYKITTSGGGIKAESTSQPAGYFSSASGYGLIVNNGNVGIGTTNPGAALEVAGQVKITGGVPGASKVLTSDAVGLASWQAPVSSGVTLPPGAVFFMITGNCPAGTTDVSATYASRFLRVNAVAGSTGGSDTVSLTTANLPSHDHGVGTLVAANESAHTHLITSQFGVGSGPPGSYVAQAWGVVQEAIMGNFFTGAGSAHTHTLSGSTGSTGSGAAVTITNPYITAKMCQVN